MKKIDFTGIKVKLPMLKRHETIIILFLGLFLISSPFIFSFYFNYLLVKVLAYILVLLGFNLLFGYTGLLSFGHALFVGIGAYTVAFYSSKFSIGSIEIMILTAIVISFVVGFALGYVCVRYIKIYFAMLTLAFGMLMYSILIKFYYITGGDEGIVISRPSIFGTTFNWMSEQNFIQYIYYYYVLFIVIIGVFFMWKIVNSPFGLTIQAIRDNPEKATYLGIDIKKYRLYSFVISGVYGSVGGVLLSPLVGHVDPSLTYWTHSGDIVFMALLGGFQSFIGPILGSFAFIFLKDFISSWTPYWRMVFGIVLAIIVITAPGGLIGVINSIRLKIKKQRGD